MILCTVHTHYTGAWLMEEEQGDCDIPNEFLDVR